MGKIPKNSGKDEAEPFTNQGHALIQLATQGATDAREIGPVVCTPGRQRPITLTLIKRKVLESIDLDAIHSNGYAFQIEMNFKTWRKGYRLCEIPIVFVDRRIGVSKMSKRIVYEAVWMVWRLKIKSLFERK